MFSYYSGLKTDTGASSVGENSEGTTLKTTTSFDRLLFIIKAMQKRLFPTPIFNHKRPRQAVISDPQISFQSSLDCQDIRNQGRPMTVADRPPQACRSNWPPAQQAPRGVTVQQTSNPRGTHGHGYPGTMSRSTPAYPDGDSNPAPTQRKPGLLPFNPRSAPTSTHSGPHPTHGPLVNKRVEGNKPNLPNPGGAAGTDTRRFPTGNRFENSVMHKQITDMPVTMPTPRGDAIAVSSVSKVNQPTQQTKNTAKKTSDTNMHFLTSRISDIKRWSQNKDRIPLIFEIFGIVDSAMLQDSSGTGKEFKLKDETGTIQCVFYEIDRSLSRLIRGQWYRCVGNFDSRTQKLGCVSVRVAGTEERSSAEIAREKSNRTMENATGMLREL
ncbi:hypothetical protein ScPMuIL_006286 [Solemya velum]